MQLRAFEQLDRNVTRQGRALRRRDRTQRFNLRTGFLAGDRSTISFEMNSLGGMFTAGSIQTAAILLGFQSF